MGREEMKRIAIGDLSVSKLALGSGRFGPEFPVAEVIDAYLELGGNFIDTAHCYAFWEERGDGASERSIADYFKKRGDRDGVVIATKGGHPSAPGYRATMKYLSPGRADAARKRALAFHRGYTSIQRVETPDEAFNNFVNCWLPRQVTYLGRTLRMSRMPCVRNLLQFAMGLTCYDPGLARLWMTRTFSAQMLDGYMCNEVSLVEGVEPSGEMPHVDMNAWPPIALDFYVRETGDESILDERVAFRDSRRKLPVFEHVCRGLNWLLRTRTGRGLCRIGRGDWNDPLNMAGYKGRGDSVWLTQALARSLDLWAQVCDRRGDRRRAARCRREAERCRDAVNRRGWDGSWYARGTTDAGRLFGVSGDREGRIYLNSQAWALISGAASPRRRRSCIRAVEKHLDTPAGPMVLGPAYTRMREDVGRITQKQAGFAENGSVYCHSAVFYAYGLYMWREGERAFRVLRDLLPGLGRNTIQAAGQLPLYIPNFYRGAGAGCTAGESSRFPGTGTASWYLLTVLEMLLGLRGQLDGLRVDPQLPGEWQRARVLRRFRGAEFDVTIERRRGARGIGVSLNGRPLPGDLVPVQRKGSRHRVAVTIPEG